MTSKSNQPYAQRAKAHKNPLVRELFQIAESKRTNVVVSADLATTAELLDIADKLGPYIVVLKTHIDIITDFNEKTIAGLKLLAEKHRFLIFEDRKFVDIGTIVQRQYHGGALRIAEWAHIVNATVLPGPGVVDALAQTAAAEEVRKLGPRGLLILAEMTSKGSLATGEYTKESIRYARRHPDFVVGFVATTSLSHLAQTLDQPADEDFVTFTTGVNRSASGDALGQQYNTPAKAIAGGADFIISGRGIYASDDPVESVKQYQAEGWEAYLRRVQS